MDRPGPAGPCPQPRGRPHGQARAAQVKEAATAKRPRREMHSPPMPASKPPCVATARSWPTAPAGDRCTQCDSLCAAPGPIACRRLGPVCQPGASPRRSRAVTGPAGQAPALWPHVRAAKAIRGRFGLMVETLPPYFTRKTSGYIQSYQHFLADSPSSLACLTPTINRPPACMCLGICTT